MRYFLALFLPPLAVLFCGKPFSTLLNILLCLCGVIPGWIHALCVVGSYNGDRRHKQLVAAIAGSNRRRVTF